MNWSASETSLPTSGSSPLQGQPSAVTQDLVQDLAMNPVEAVEELKRRLATTDLHQKVLDYLEGDIPSYFADEPVLYLGRHIATPNFETIRFLHLTEPLGLKPVVSQDTRDLFVDQNTAKRALCKLPVLKRIAMVDGRPHEHIEYATIVDFSKSNGAPFSSIKTRWGESLTDFHANLFETILPGRLQSADDSAWIDRHHRGDVQKHFQKLLALFLVHGILYEDYVPADEKFVRTVLRPAFAFIEKKFGYRPLLVQLVPRTLESELFWISYPHEVLSIVKERMNG